MANNRLLIQCAPSGIGKGSNLGMQTVDFAAHNLIQRLSLGDRGLLLHPWKPLDVRAGGDPEILKQDKWPCQFLETGDCSPKPGDLLLSWGDFQLGHDYQKQSSIRYQKLQEQLGNEITNESAIDWCYRTFLKEHQLDNSEFDIGTFGSTLFQNRLTDWSNPRYRDAIEKFLEKSKLIAFRDPYSAWSATRILGGTPSDYWSSDAAFLNSPEDFSHLDTSGYFENIKTGSIGLYLGRSTRRTSKWGISLLARQFSKKLDSEIVWIPWNRFSGNGLFKRIPKLLPWFLPKLIQISPDDFVMAGDIFKIISRCRLLITDTYHVAVNAMCLGIPVLCIYEPSPATKRDANMGYRESWRDKRALLFTSTNQSDFLMASEDLKSKRYRHEKAAHIHSIIDDDNTMKFWRAWIKDERDRNRKNLESKLRSLMGI